MTVRGLGNTTGLFVLALIAGNDVEDSGFKDGSCRQGSGSAEMVDAAGHMDRDNQALRRRVCKAGEVSTLAGNGEEGFAYGQGDARTLAGSGGAELADGQGAAARFHYPTGLAWGKDGSILVADAGNNAVRRVTVEGKVSTVGGNGQEGCADREGATSLFNYPTWLVDKEGTIVVADTRKQCLREIVGW